MSRGQGGKPEKPAKPESAMRQAALARAEEPPKKFYAPLIAGAIVVVAIIAVVLYSVLTPKAKLTVDTLKQPVVAALGAGDGLYAANSKQGMTEVVKFGYLPAVELGQTSDGTLVLANPTTAQSDMGLSKPLEQTSTNDFLAAKIKPRKGVQSHEDGTPLTFAQALDSMGDATVFVPQVGSADQVAPFLSAVHDHGRTDAVIARTGDLGVLAKLQSTDNDKLAKMYEVPGTADSGAAASGDSGAAAQKSAEPAKPAHAATPQQAKDAGATMVAVPAGAKDLDTWLKSGLKVWVTGAKDKKQLDGLAKRGVYGALAHNPFTVQPSAVKTD